MIITQVKNIIIFCDSVVKRMVKVNIEALPKKMYAKTINNPCLKVGINTTLFLLTTLVLKILMLIFYLDRNKKLTSLLT